MPEVSQGSSQLATLGLIAESLWDSRSLASIKIRVRCGVLGRCNLRKVASAGEYGRSDACEPFCARGRAHSATNN